MLQYNLFKELHKKRQSEWLSFFLEKFEFFSESSVQCLYIRMTVKGGKMPNTYNIYDEALLSKEGERQLALLKLIYKNSGIEIEELVFKLNLDRRSIYKTIEQLKEVIKRHHIPTVIDVSSRGNYTFHGDKIDYYKIRARVVDEEPIIELIKILLEQKSIDLIEFCASQFISESTLKRHLSKLNRLLVPLHIRLSTQKGKLYIKGAEAKIRYGLTSLFWRYYHGVMWPFKRLEEVQVHRIISTLFTARAPLSYGKKKQLSYLIAIFILRAQTGEEVLREDLPDYFEALTLDNPSFKVFAEEISQTLKLSSYEKAILFLSLYIFPESYHYIQNTSKTLEAMTKREPESYNSIKNFILFVKTKHPEFDIVAESRRNFVFMVIASRIFVDVFGDVYFNISSIAIFTYAGNNYPNLLPTIAREIQKKEPTLSLNTLKGLTLRYAQAYVFEFSPQDFEPKIQILLNTDVPMYLDKVLVQRLNQLLSSKFNYEWVSLEQNRRPNLLVTTGVVEEKFLSVPKVFINPELTKKDEENIVEACDKLVKEKRKNKAQNNGLDGTLFFKQK